MDGRVIYGADLLMSIGGKVVGYCKTHTAKFDSELKELTVKAPKSVTKKAGKFKEKMVVAQSSTIDVEALQFVAPAEGDTGLDAKAMRKAWKDGVAVEIELFERADAPEPYCKGDYIVKSYQDSAPGDDTASYSCSLENSGEVLLDEEIAAAQAG